MSTVNLDERITVNPNQSGGRPCMRGMRIRVIDVLELQANGLTPAQILEEMPDLEMEDLQAVARYAARRLDHPVLALAA
ncbi:MAG: DUF433 domain-containing protein [Chloroflexota bacterium]|nr:DUF433 domain-containing protein [Chloroflexota bacterium]